MINKIDTLRTVAKNLSSHIFMEGKTKITKPGVIIPGAMAVTGVTITLETKDNSANLVVERDNNELQRATFDYKETPEGYELVSGMSSYFCDDKEKKEVHQNHYLIEPEQEKTYEYSVNYSEAPMKKNIRKYIDKINSSVAQVSGYKSNKTEYDKEESHTYGKKSLQRDIPALLKLLEIIAPDSEFTIKMKDKLKKDNKTSLFAFEVNGIEKGKEIVKGFMSTNGDSVSYRINTEDMKIVGEQSDNVDFSRAYLKPVTTVLEQTNIKEAENKEEVKRETAEKIPDKKPAKEIDVENPQRKTTEKSTNKDEEKKAKQKTGNKKTANSKPDTKAVSAKTLEKEIIAEAKTETETANPLSTEEQTPQTVTERTNRLNSIEYYTNLILEAAASKKLAPRQKAEKYKEILAQAYLDGYEREELEKILSGNGINPFSRYCKKAYVETGIVLAENGKVKPQQPVKTLDDKITELKNIEIDIDDENLKNCVQNMIIDIADIQDDTVVETYFDKALNLLKNNSSNDLKTDLLTFIQEAGKLNDDLKLHYEIYCELVNDVQVEALKSQIEQMINNISDTKHHKKRDAFLAQLYIANDLDELEQLKKDVQQLLNEQHLPQTIVELSEKDQSQKMSIEDLSSTNKKIVKRLLDCKSPSDMCLTFSEIKNLLLDMGFTKGSVDGSHHKFLPPKELFFNGRKQAFLIVADKGKKTQNPALMDDLINVCKQYYGAEN